MLVDNMPCRHRRRAEEQLYAFLILAPHPGYFTHVKKPQYHCMEGWVGSSVGLDQHGE